MDEAIPRDYFVPMEAFYSSTTIWVTFGIAILSIIGFVYLLLEKATFRNREFRLDRKGAIHLPRRPKLSLSKVYMAESPDPRIKALLEEEAHKARNRVQQRSYFKL